MITEWYFMALGSTKCSELTDQWLQIMYLEGQCMDSDRIPEWGGAMVFLPDQTFLTLSLNIHFSSNLIKSKQLFSAFI